MIKPPAIESAHGGVPVEKVGSLEREQKPQYLRVTAGELMSLLNKPSIEGQNESSVWGRLVKGVNQENGDLQKKDLLRDLRFSFVRRPESTRGLQFLIRQSAEAGAQAQTSDGILELLEEGQEVTPDQIVDADGILEVDAQRFLETLFETLYLMGRMKIVEKKKGESGKEKEDSAKEELAQIERLSLLRERIGEEFAGTKLRTVFKKSRWEEAGGKTTLSTAVAYELTDDELTVMYRRQNIRKEDIPEMVAKTPPLARRVVVPQEIKITPTAYITSIEIVEPTKQNEVEVKAGDELTETVA